VNLQLDDADLSRAEEAVRGVRGCADAGKSLPGCGVAGLTTRT
jgi:hypothetical protein